MTHYIKILAFLLLLLVGAQSVLIAQYSSLDTIRADFNNDKIIDTLIENYNRGSAFGGKEVVIINGKTKEKFKLSNYRGYSSSIIAIDISDNLQLEKNKAFLDTLKNRLIFYKKKDRIDPTLQWIMSASFNNEVFNNPYSEGKEHPYFDVVLNPQTRWETHKPFISEPYYIEVAGDTLQKFLNQIKEDPVVTKKPKGYLTYFAPRISSTYKHSLETLDSLQPIEKNDEYEIYKTVHSIYVKKGNEHKWLFISDSEATPAPDNLYRWESMGQVKLIDHYVIIHQNVPPDNAYNIIIVNIETQEVGVLSRKYEPSYNNGTDEGGMTTFEIIDNELVFSEYGVQELHKIPLNKLFESLDNY